MPGANWIRLTVGPVPAVGGGVDEIVGKTGGKVAIPVGAGGSVAVGTIGVGVNVGGAVGKGVDVGVGEPLHAASVSANKISHGINRVIFMGLKFQVAGFLQPESKSTAYTCS